MFTKRNCWLCCLAACLGVVFVVAPAAADGPKGTAVIKGKVVFDGTPPRIKPLIMKADPVCAKAHSKPVAAQSLIVYKKEGNAIPFVFVYVKKGITGKYDVPKKPVTINQLGCMYHPHVFGMVAGQEMDILNSDPVNHNIHSLARKNPAFNFAQPNKGMLKKLVGSNTFTKPEVMVRIKCDVHAWMSCYVGVMKHPFFDVTKSHLDTDNKAERGTFEIKGLPAGDYVLEAWHEKFGKVTQKVSVKDGETKEIVIKLNPKRAQAPSYRTVELASAADNPEQTQNDAADAAQAAEGEAESGSTAQSAEPATRE